MPDESLTADINALFAKHLAAIVIWGGLALGGFVGWNLNSTIAIEQAIATTAERSTATQFALAEYIREATAVGKENQIVLNQIKTDIEVIKERLVE